MQNPYREELRQLLNRTETIRPAVLRRSRNETFLYATDLPKVSSERNVKKFVDEIRNSGWISERYGDWLLLDRPIESPPDELIPAAGPEALCCFSIQVRHALNGNASDRKAERNLIKSAEEGPAFYEKACQNLHRQWSADLRTNGIIPAMDLKYFTGGQDI